MTRSRLFVRRTVLAAIRGLLLIAVAALAAGVLSRRPLLIVAGGLCLLLAWILGAAARWAVRSARRTEGKSR